MRDRTDGMAADCALAAWRGDRRRCRMCDGELPGRCRKWCSERCSTGFWQNHVWALARDTALRRDRWRCRACGKVGWNDVPASVLPGYGPDRRVHRGPASQRQWAVAFGFVDDAPIADYSLPWREVRRRQQAVDDACRRLPDSCRASWRVSSAPPCRRTATGSYGTGG